MKINSAKSNLLFSWNDNVSANMDGSTVIAENNNELLGILDKLWAILELKLSFENHIKNLCKKDVKHSTH